MRIWYKSWPKRVPKKINFNNFSIDYILSKHARKFPGRTAINYYGRIITYGELEELTDSFAASLAELGVQRGDRVCLYMGNCPQFIIALIGGWKIGALMVPANPMFLADELAYQLIDAGVETIILQDDLLPVFNSVRERTEVKNAVFTRRTDFLPESPTLPLHHTLTTLPHDGGPNTISFLGLLSRARKITGHEVNMDDLALLPYTAGTTGMPKGAMVTHRNLIFNAAGSVAWYNNCPADVHLAVLPLFEVTGLLHAMATIYSGGTIVLLARYDTETVLEAVELYGCTHWASVATMNIAVVNYPYKYKWDLSSLRVCSSGGVPVPPEVVQSFQALTGACLVEGYGLTETIGQATINPLQNARPGSVGIPVQETDIKIVEIDDHHKEVLPGEEGELLIKGPQVMKGYWNRPEETRNAFSEGWFVTGDIAWMDGDGFVYIVGRKKELIKASGFIIFPQEVEKYLKRHPAVAEAAVVGVPHTYRIETVKAYVVLKTEFVNKISEAEIINWSRQKMAAYKYPREVEFVDELPHNGEGKVLRHFLRKHGDGSVASKI